MIGSTAGAMPHVLVIPFPAQGHLLPLLDLAADLCLRHSFSATVAVTPSNVPLLSAFLSSVPSAAALNLPSPPPHPAVPDGAEHVRDLPPTHHGSLLALSLAGLRPHILSWTLAHRVTFIISDFFLGWTQHLAADLAVPRIVFYTSGAFAVSVIQASLHLPPSVTAGMDSVELPELPSSPSFPYEHLPTVCRCCHRIAPSSPFRLVKEGFLANMDSWGAVVNTFDAMETEFLTHLRRIHKHGLVWAVGPLHPVVSGNAPRDGDRSMIDWLDGCPPRSVVYICFGSQYTPSEAQAAALGEALEASGARFLWVISKGSVALPSGFQRQTAVRGAVFHGWAPQVEILNHRAVASFLTHCGWNSALEAAAAGVPLIAWPMMGDQFVNARLLVEWLGVAVRAAEGATAVPDVAELVAVLAAAVEQRESGAWAETRRKAEELANVVSATVADSGSSSKEMENLIKTLEKIEQRKTKL